MPSSWLADDCAERSLISRRTMFGLAALPALIAISGEAQASQSPRASFLHDFKYVGGDKERQRRDAAIEDVVSGMNLFARGIARDKLLEANAIAASLRFSCDATSLTVRADEHAFTGPLDGKVVKIKSSAGEDMDMHFSFPGEQIEQTISAHDGGRVNRASLQKGDSTLSLAVRVFSSRLPKDLVYSLTYQAG